jgi:hypothetical protein
MELEKILEEKSTESFQYRSMLFDRSLPLREDIAEHAKIVSLSTHPDVLYLPHTLIKEIIRRCPRYLGKIQVIDLD